MRVKRAKRAIFFIEAKSVSMNIIKLILKPRGMVEIGLE